MAKIMVGMSGGVDSSVVAALLKEQGHHVFGVTLSLFSDHRDIEDAKRVAESLDIPHTVLDLQEVFQKEVIQYFIDTYYLGKTPNPCVMCNKKIKFGAMLDYALQQGCDGIATGHYAGIVRDEKGIHLTQSDYFPKDQSYVLYHLTPDQLKRIWFPLQAMPKDEVRDIAKRFHLPVAQKADSQEICFIPDDDYIRFLLEQDPRPVPIGDFIDGRGNVLGQHKGILYYTIGQRKGLGISFGKPMYVTAIDPLHHTVTLGESGEEYQTSLRADDLNWIEPVESEFTAEAMVRYRSKRHAARVVLQGDGTAEVHFMEPTRAITPGQAVVFYQGSTCLGGGTIL